MNPHLPLPAGYIETDRGVFERKTIHWFNMDIAPRNGQPFVWCKPTTILGKDKYVTINLLPLLRDIRHSVAGVWMSCGHSIPDDYTKHGWWAHSVPVTGRGQIILPFGAMSFIKDRET